MSQAMQGIMSNPEFAKMAEDIGKKMFESDPQLANMVKSMQDTDTRDRMQAKMEELKEDPELKHVIEELESGGPSAMMKYALHLDLKYFVDFVCLATT